MSNTTSNSLKLLAQIPTCVQPLIFKGLAASDCGFDFSCVCTNDAFLSLLQGSIEQACDRSDTDNVLAFARTLCTTALPSLNESRATLILGVFITITTLSTLAVVLRLLARSLSSARFWWDDGLIVGAFILTLAEDIDVFVALGNGFGRHVVVLNLDQLTGFAKSFFATQILFGSAVTATKLSILFFYHRILPSRRFRVLSIITGSIAMVWWIALIFTVIFSCQPVQFFWDKSIQGGTCLDENLISYATTGVNIATDLGVLCLPIPWLWKLQMPLSRKLNVIGIFILGGLVCVAGIVRIPLLIQLKQSDATWTIVNAGIWINIETNLGIVCACLPTLRPLLLHVSPFFSNLSSSYSSSNKSLQPPKSDSSELRAGRGNHSNINTGPYDSKFGSSRARIPSTARIGNTSTVKASPHKGRFSRQSWYGNVMASFARVDREQNMRAQQEWIKLRDQGNTV